MNTWNGAPLVSESPPRPRRRTPIFIWAAFIAFAASAYGTFAIITASDGIDGPSPAGVLTIVLLVLHVTPLLALQHRYLGVRVWQAFVASALLGAACMLFPFYVRLPGSGFGLVPGLGFTPVATLVVYEMLRRTRLAEGVAPRG